MNDKQLTGNVLENFFLNPEVPKKICTFQRGEYLFREGYPTDKIYYILQGKVKICINNANGRSLLVCFLHRHSVLGEIEAFLDNTAFTTVQAVTSLKCICISSKTLYDAALSDTELMLSITKILAYRSQYSIRNASLNILCTAEERVCSYIAETNIDGIFSENLSELCDMLGTSYRHLHRTLVRLCEMNILRKIAYGYEIVDSEELERISAGKYGAYGKYNF